MIWILGLLALGFGAWRAGRRLRFFLHIHQLEGYKNGPYLRWVFSRPLDVILRMSHLAGAAILAGLAAGLPLWIGLLLWPMAFASSRRYRRDRPKKPLVMTSRMSREAATAGLLAVALVAAGLFGPADPSWIGLLAGLGAADLLAPVLVWLAALAMAPVESAVREGFKRQARRRLAARPDLKIVAITGSYGKTSVKFAVAEVLSQRYQVLATPGSFNTPMGICKVINNDLQRHHQVLVLEMGIRHPGDIAELCAIARPDVAVITGIGVAHLETMGSQDAIAREKGSLLNFLRPGGRAVLNADDAYYHGMAARAEHLSVSSAGAAADLVASDVRFSAEGTSFSVTEDDRTHTARLRLLGRHHVGNALLALGVGRLFGIRTRSAVHALGRLEPVPHRLSQRAEAGLLVLDDAFNSNPVGARNAVEVLGAFAPRQRFIVTPGMVELGEQEVEQNRALGAFMADHVDHAILVGPARTAAIFEGLQSRDFPADRVHVVNTLFEGRELLASLARAGDVVLYENDLPDQYTEA